MTLQIVWHPSCLAHDAGPDHVESPARLRAVLDVLRSWTLSTEVVWHEAAAIDDGALLRVHTQDHLDTLARVSRRGGGMLDNDTFMNAQSELAARCAVGAAVHATKLALEGCPSFAAVRPPGHHATADRAMGFCLLNNVVVAARYAVEEAGIGRVLIIDWDVHHGNGTQALVEADARIRYVSLHQWPLYPGTGRSDERGVGNIFNLPRPPGLPRERYVADLQAAVERATAGWHPDLLLISAGFDGMRGDPLGGFTLEPEDFATWMARWREWGTPIASMLEGGYAPHRVAAGVAAHLRVLA